MQTINKVIPAFKIKIYLPGAIDLHEQYRTFSSYGKKLTLANVDLRRERITNRNLDACEMEHVDLSCCVLTDTSFKKAALNHCDFGATYCKGVNFSGTNLDTCNFEGAYLANAIGDGRNIHTLTTDPYLITFTNDWIWLGEFENFSIRELMNMDEFAIKSAGVDLDWWTLYRPVLEVLFCQLEIRWKY